MIYSVLLRVYRVCLSISTLLVDLEPELYRPYFVYENGKKTLYVEVLKALYGMLIATLLWYKKYKFDIEKEDLFLILTIPVLQTKKLMVPNKLSDFMWMMWWVVIKIKVNNELYKWLNKMYGSYREVKATHGPVYEYLGMEFDFLREVK